MTRYAVRHRTTYRYFEDVASSRHNLHVVPRDSPRQRVTAVALEIAPVPARHVRRRDAFENTMDLLAFDEPHAHLQIVARSEVTVGDLPPPDPEAPPAWEDVRTRLERAIDAETRDAVQYLFDTALITASAPVVAYAAPTFAPGRPLLEAALELTARIHADFRYAKAVTDAATPVERVFELRAGVCQDLAHAGIAAMRAMGLAARYVSGYRHTEPAPGNEGADGTAQSHAWFSVWVPPYGWVDLDPTSNELVAADHVTVAWGRCYQDVAPVHGIVTGGSEHALTVGVDVVRLD